MGRRQAQYVGQTGRFPQAVGVCRGGGGGGGGRTYVYLLLAGIVHHQAHGQGVVAVLGDGQLGPAGVLQNPQLPLVLKGYERGLLDSEDSTVLLQGVT